MEENKYREIPEDGKKEEKPKYRIVPTILISLIGVACVFLCGVPETLLGCLVWIILRGMLGKDRPGALWPDIVGILVGVVVAFGSALLYSIIMGSL